MSILEKAKLQIEMGFTGRTIANRQSYAYDPYVYVQSKYHDFKDPSILNVKRARLKKGWNRKYVSEITGIGIKRLENIESLNHLYEIKSYELEKLSKIYGCDKEDLLG